MRPGIHASDKYEDPTVFGAARGISVLKFDAFPVIVSGLNSVVNCALQIVAERRITIAH